MSDQKPFSETSVFKSVEAPSSSVFIARPNAELDGRFKLVRQIGEGGMGVVYLATQLNINRSVVIKLLKPHLCANDEQVQRFKREASLASRLSHPNCVTIHDFGFYQETPYIVMEHLEGESLVDHIYQDGRLDFSQTVSLLTQICDALESAQALEVVHRDLKPENIFVLREPQGNINLKVLDFGIAKLAHTHPEASDAQLTRGDMIFGTPHYMAPEQIRGKPIDHRADLYALTILFYEMLTGHLPYDSDDAQDHVSILTQHLRDPIPEIVADEVEAKVRPIIGAVNELIRRGMEKEVERRIESAASLRAELQALLERADAIAAQSNLTKTSSSDAQGSINHTFAAPNPLASNPLILDPLAPSSPPSSSPIKVVDLLPRDQSRDPFQEPSLTLNPLSESGDLQQLVSSAQVAPHQRLLPSAHPTRLVHHTFGDGGRTPQYHSGGASSSSGFGRVVRWVLVSALIALLSLGALTYPRSPVALEQWSVEWRSRVPLGVRRTLSLFKKQARPVYIWVDKLFHEPAQKLREVKSPPVTSRPAHDSASAGRGGLKLRPHEARYVNGQGDSLPSPEPMGAAVRHDDAR